jgi:Ca2+-binding RTX toxin-like protein
MATVIGKDTNEFLSGTTGNDLIKGFGGNDTLKGGGGADQLYGGVGIDTALYTDSNVSVYVNLLYNDGRYGTAQGDTYFSIENVIGSAYNDIVYGDNNPNTLTGLDGDDLLLGNGGTDVLDGGYGDDHLEGGAHADVMYGGPGIDIVSYQHAPSGVSAALRSYGYGGDAQGDVLYDVEGLTGSEYNDSLDGDSAVNYLNGAGGVDIIYGFGGNDRIQGGFGNDTVYGHDGSDLLEGDGGDDTLYPGLDTDRLNGGADADRFIWNTTGELGWTVATFDVVEDFSRAAGDLLGFSGIDANEALAGDQSFRFIGRAAFSQPGEIRYEDWRGDTYIYVNTDADRDFEGGIRLEGIHTPDPSWFYL